MDLVTSTSLVMAASVVFSALPFLFSGLKAHARALNLIGGIVLAAILFADIVPEMVEHAGPWSLLIIVGAFAAFTVFHKLTEPVAKTHAGHGHDIGCHSGYWLAGSLALHCLSCGLLLCASESISETFAFNITMGLVLHKAVEAFALSSLLIEQAGEKRKLFISIGLYTISFPIGVAIAELGIGGENLEHLAILMAGLGVGALFGCLVQDVFLPALKSLRLGIVAKETV